MHYVYFSPYAILFLLENSMDNNIQICHKCIIELYLQKQYMIVRSMQFSPESKL